MRPESIRRPGPTSDTLRCELTRDLPDSLSRQALTFCYSASKIDADSIGWLPRQAYDTRHTDGELLVLFNNDDLVAFVLMSKPSAYQELRCLQIWVRPDARVILHGRTILQKFQQLAIERGCIRVRCWCAEDLPSNLFWSAMGWQKKTWRHGPARTARRHNLWALPITRGLRFLAQAQPSRTVESAQATIWVPPHLDAAAV